MNNDAFKHVEGENKNESWTRLLKDLKFYDESTGSHTMYMRNRFISGALEWMAGGNGSKQDYKSLFGYTDSEWAYIWSTLCEDGAWAVPSIKDDKGSTVKANFAPEILIKFIAHELRCHIIVFDLLLQRVQFLSGNHIKSDNVVFKSPLLIYNTGGHFQSVFQEDHEYFVNYAERLESEINDTESENQQRSESTSEKESQDNKQTHSPKTARKLDTSLSQCKDSEVNVEKELFEKPKNRACVKKKVKQQKDDSIFCVETLSLIHI